MRLIQLSAGLVPACLFVFSTVAGPAAAQGSATSAGPQAGTPVRALRSPGPGPRPIVGPPKALTRPGGRSAGPPPPNDACASATPIAGTGAFAFDNSNATTGGPEACLAFGTTGIDDDVWYCWTAPASGPYQLFTCGQTGVDTKIAVYPGCGTCPPALNDMIACNDDTCGLQSAVSFTAVQAQEYLIRVGTFPGAGGGAGTFTIAPGCQTAADCQSSGPTAQGIVAYLGDENGGVERLADNFRTTQAGALSNVCWYGFYADAFDSECLSADDFTVTYYADDAGGFSPGSLVAGPFDVAATRVPSGDVVTTSVGDFAEYVYTASHAPVAVLAGTCLWVQITNQSAGDGCDWFWSASGDGDGLMYWIAPGSNGTFLGDLSFCVDVPFAPGGCQVLSNDLCSDALEITGLGNFPFNNIMATDSPGGVPDPNCGGGTIEPTRDIWYCWESVCTGTVTLTTCDLTGVDTVVAVYHDSNNPGACACSSFGANLLGCNDDACGLQSELSFQAQEGERYLIRIGAFPGGLPGVGLFNIRCDCPAVNQTVPGSLIVWPEFQNQSGTKTVLTVSSVNCLDPDNQQLEDSVNIHMIFRSGLNCDPAAYAPPCCQELDFDFDLTPCDSYTLIVDDTFLSPAGFPEGFVYAYARRQTDEVAITFNQLIADMVIFDGFDGSMYRVKPYVFRGLGAPGQPTDDAIDGVGDGDSFLELNGVEYQPVADEFIVPRVMGARPPAAGITGIENELVLVSLTGTPQAVTTVRAFLHLDDVPGVDREKQFRFRCWQRVLLDVNESPDFDPPGNPVQFDLEGRQAGWMRVDGELLSLPGQPDVFDPAFLMLFVERQRTLGGDVSESASRPFELCTQENADNLQSLN